MSSLPYLLIVWIYYKTFKYQRLIDDPVPRSKVYLWGPQKVKPDFYEQTRPKRDVILSIITFMGSTGYIHLLFGWKAALLYSVFPLNVWSVAWITGSYYQGAVLLCLSAFYWVTNLSTMPFNWAEMPLESIFISVTSLALSLCSFIGALNSATNTLSFMFILPLFTPYWWVFLFPFIRFLKGRRWRTALKWRQKRHDNIKIHTGFRWVHILNIPKILAYYAYISIFPVRLGFFHSFGVQKDYMTKKTLIVCGVFILLIFNIFLYIDWRMCLWWFFGVGLFTHFMGTRGQYICERYTAISNVAFCVLLSHFLYNDILFTIVASLYFAKSLNYTEVWRNNETLFHHNMSTQYETPEPFNNLANLYVDRGELSSAVRPLQVAEVLTRGDKFNIYITLCKCYHAARQYTKSMEYIEKALKSNYPENEYNRLIEYRNDINNRLVTLKKHNKELRKLGIIK